MNGARWLAAAAVFAAGVVCYANSFTGVLVFDDLKHVESWERAARSPAEFWSFVSHSGLRSLANATFALNYALHGRDLFGYHVVNLAIHLLAGLTLLGLARRTLELPSLPTNLRTHAAGLSLAIALLWTVHPLTTQAVTYLMQRSESLMGLFYLLFLYCLVRSQASPYARWWQGAAVVSCYLGFGAKEVMVTAPVAALLFDRVFLAASWRDVWRARGWMHAACLLRMIVSFNVLGPLLLDPTRDATAGFAQQSVSARDYALTQPGVVLHYFSLVVWPWNLCLDYDWPVARGAIAIGLPLAAIGLILLTILLAWQRYPRVACLATLVFLILAPTSSIVPIKDLAFEHRMYLPLAGVVALMVLGGYQLLERLQTRQPALPKWLPLAIVASAATLLGVRTFIRNEDYRSVAAIWLSTVRVVPQNARACHNLAVELESQNRSDEAIAIVTQAGIATAIRGLPTAQHQILLGDLYARQFDFPRAIEHLTRGIDQFGEPDALPEFRRYELADHYVSLGAAYALSGDPSRARTALNAALELRPNNRHAQTMLDELPP